MSYFEAVTSCIFREDTAGRRLFRPYGRRFYVVPPGEETRIKRAFFAYTMAVIPAIVIAALTIFWIWPPFVIFPAWMLGYYPAMAWVVRRLERAIDPDLKPFPFTARLDASARAMGRPLLRMFTLASVLVTLMGAFTAMYLPMFGEPLQWAAAALWALFATSGLAQLWRTRKDP